MDVEELQFLFAIEPIWTVSLNDRDWVTLPGSEVQVNENIVHAGKWSRRISGLRWLRPDVVQILGRARFRSEVDRLTFYPGQRLPPRAEILRRRRGFQKEIAAAIRSHFGVGQIERESRYSDRRHSIGAAYCRFLIGSRAVIAVDPDEAATTVNGILRAAILWSRLTRRRMSVIVPLGRHATLSLRLEHLPEARRRFDWLGWTGSALVPLPPAAAEPDTKVSPFVPIDAASQVESLLATAPGLLQAVPDIAGGRISIRMRGLEVAVVSAAGVGFPLGEPLREVVEKLDALRRPTSRHVLARTHEERWLESKILEDVTRIVPGLNPAHVYPQVPSFVGGDRNIIDLLGVTDTGRLVVMEIKASPDPDLPFQALDYWIAVERHRLAGDFERCGYFRGVRLADESPMLVMVAPLLAFHPTFDVLTSMAPRETQIVQLGLNQNWKRSIKVLRRRGRAS